jgi:hypothetical protein
MPWSWLADWFANIGDVLENWDPGVAETLINDYAYVMRHSWSGVTATASGTFWTGRGDGIVKASASTTHELHVKERDVANPFGFALKDDELTSTQQTILAAIGASKGRR